MGFQQAVAIQPEGNVAFVFDEKAGLKSAPDR